MRIEIQTDADFTPKGKRTARFVAVRSVFGRGTQLRWYVAGRIYRCLKVTQENTRLTIDWLAA